MPFHPYQLGLVVLVVGLIEWLKRTGKISFINADTATLNRVIGGIAAVATATGFHLAMDGSLFAGGVLHVTFPPLSEWGKLLSESATQFGAQTVYYQIVHGDFGKALAALAEATKQQQQANAKP